MKSLDLRGSLNTIFKRLLWVQFFIPILLIALTVLGVAAYLGGQSYIRQELKLTYTMAFAVNEYLDNASAVLETLTDRADPSNLSELSFTLDLVQRGLNSYEAFYLLDSQGIVQTMVPANSAYIGLDWSRQKFFSESLTSSEVVISKPFISVRSNQPAVILSKRLPNDSVLAGELNLAELQRLTNSSGMQRMRQSEIFVTDEAGNLLAHPDSGLVARQENMSDLPIVREQGRHGSQSKDTLVYGYRGRLYLGGATRIEASSWLIITQTPLLEIYFPYYGPALLTLLLSIILLAVFIRIIFQQLKRQIILPLGKLSSFTSQISAGSYSADREMHTIPNTFSELTQLATDFSHMSTAIQKRTQDLENLASFDQLTRLANRSFFHDQVNALIEQDRASHCRFALVFIDLDDFKSINEAFGHTRGDQVLCMIADLIKRPNPNRLLTGRLGGDAFAVVLRVRYTHEAAGLAKGLLADLNQPMQINNHQVYISPSIGISFFPEDGDQADVLIQKADTAMNNAKSEGKNGFQIYSLAMETQAQERHAFTSHLHHALEFNELSLVYQPIVHTSSRQRAGVEALLRWNNPRLGSVSPNKFIPLANESGLILPIGEWILQSACRQTYQWSLTASPLWVSINIAERQLKHNGLIDSLARVLEESHLPPHLLRLELTEDIVFQHYKEINQVINEIKRLGITLALDDFGTGYSTLSCLTQIPFDVIKIDRSLVCQVTCDPREAAIVSGIIRISKDLGMEVVAEGIETEAQIEFFERLGCDLLQGYFFSPPLPPSAF